MATTRLTVLQEGGAPTPSDLLRRALHAEQEYMTTLADVVELPCGLALVSPEFSRMAGANQMREVAIPAGQPIETVLAEVEAVFATRGLTCYRWEFAAGKVPPALGDALKARGYYQHRLDLWLLQKPPALAPRPDIMVIPSRASFAKLAELAEAAERAWCTTDPVELAQYGPTAVRQLDDPRIDGFLALQDGQPVGTVNLIVLGDFALIVDLYTRPGHERQGVATSLLTHLLELAGRSRVRYLTLFCDVRALPAHALYAKTGFVRVATADCLTLREKD